MNETTTLKTPEQLDASARCDASHGSARYAAWMNIPPLLRGCTDYADFSEGWKAAFRAIRDRLPSSEYLSDPLTPREVQHLVSFVEEQISSNVKSSNPGRGCA